MPVTRFRSRFEARFAAHLESLGIPVDYETARIKYTKPAIGSVYTPDFRLPNGVFVETKGVFSAKDRKKHLLIKEQHPELDIRFVFQRSTNALYKGSPTTYGEWCDEHGFKYADTTIPKEWLNHG